LVGWLVVHLSIRPGGRSGTARAMASPKILNDFKIILASGLYYFFCTLMLIVHDSNDRKCEFRTIVIFSTLNS
jgi:hypothetical protein